jgi:hypothetical protein
MDNSINPFLYGNPVFPNNFIGRQFEIRGTYFYQPYYLSGA